MILATKDEPMIERERITSTRLFNQQLTAPTFTDAAQVVGWMGAVQAQDYVGSLWALGLRMDGASEAAVEAAFNEGAILRTHVLRPTWHYVLPADIRWMLDLTAPRVRMLLAYYDRQLELDAPLLSRCCAVIERELRGGQHKTRQELGAALAAEGIDTSSVQRLGHIMGHAELNQLVCSGARRGKQQTYALLDERAPAAKSFARDEALAALTLRYFASHAPATIKDFAWWSGLTIADAKQGLELNAGRIASDVIDGETYWFTDSPAIIQPTEPTAYLLPNFDEYTVAYTDRSPIIDETRAPMLRDRYGVLVNVVVYDGHVIGEWKRTLKKGSVIVQLYPLMLFTAKQEQAVTAAAQRYADFVGLKLVLEA